MDGMSAVLESTLTSHQRAFDRVGLYVGSDPAASNWTAALRLALAKNTKDFHSAGQKTLAAVNNLLSRQASDRQIITGAVVPLVALRTGAKLLQDQNLVSELKTTLTGLVAQLSPRDPFCGKILADLRVLRQLPQDQSTVKNLLECPPEILAALQEGRLLRAWGQSRRSGIKAPMLVAIAVQEMDEGRIAPEDLFQNMKGRTEHMTPELVTNLAAATAVRLCKAGAFHSSLACVSLIQDQAAIMELSKVLAIGIAAHAASITNKA